MKVVRPQKSADNEPKQTGFSNNSGASADQQRIDKILDKISR